MIKPNTLSKYEGDDMCSVYVPAYKNEIASPGRMREITESGNYETRSCASIWWLWKECQGGYWLIARTDLDA